MIYGPLPQVFFCWMAGCACCICCHRFGAVIMALLRLYNLGRSCCAFVILHCMLAHGTAQSASVLLA